MITDGFAYMAENRIIDISHVREQDIYTLSDKFRGRGADGEIIDFTNYYMRKNGRPFIGISGECHYSRVCESRWEDTLAMMKAGGINIVSTYVFWIHHEEIEGQFDFAGNKNIRKFAEICGRLGMYLIVRIGPFDHGEVRNGGMPDWILGKPYDIRCASEGFISQVKIFYDRLGEELKGLMYKDGGPIIATQLENEYMHSSAPWEDMYGSTNEWIDSIRDDNYIPELKRLAKEAGIDTPFYTCTAWGGGVAPIDEVLPLWGGYAYWPWIYPQHEGEHPLTPEYIYRDYHNNAIPSCYNFDPAYQPEQMPYSCCEMGGGMFVSYYYRFKLDYKSVDAMANIKLAGGCNFLGYYMYAGGSNPYGSRNRYMNEGQCPKITYDFQAPIGEYGQVRDSYKRLKCIHLFLKNFGEDMADYVTSIPEENVTEPSEVDKLRFAVRSNGQEGYLFINNFQDHTENHDLKDRAIKIICKENQITFNSFCIAAGENAILPINMKLDEGLVLKSACAQPLSIIREDKKTSLIFFTPMGMKPEYVFDKAVLNNWRVSLEGSSDLNSNKMCIREEESELVIAGEKLYKNRIVFHLDADEKAYNVTDKDGYNDECKEAYDKAHNNAYNKGSGKDIEIITLSRSQALDFYELDDKGHKSWMISDSPLLVKNGRVCKITLDSKEEISFDETGCLKYTIKLPETCEKYYNRILRIDYVGDVGQAFINGQLVADNYYNGNSWEIGLKELYERVPEAAGSTMVIRIVPIKLERGVDVSSVMAGRMEIAGDKKGSLERIRLTNLIWGRS